MTQEKESVNSAYKEYAEFLTQKLDERDEVEHKVAVFKAKMKGTLSLIDEEINRCRTAISSGTFQTNIFDKETTIFHK